MPWPPKSPTMQTFPEIDRAEWFNLDIAREKILKAQLPFLDRLEKITSTGFDDRNVDPA
jgi:predicted NUDIX family NTP pyrophosphohydrolase